MSALNVVLRRPLTVIILIIALALGAGIAVQRMARDVFPPLGIPTIYVAQPYGGIDPAQMEGWLTFYYEYHFLYITGIEHVESKSIQGASIQAAVPSWDGYGSSDERSGSLRESPARVHAAGDAWSVHHAL